MLFVLFVPIPRMDGEKKVGEFADQANLAHHLFVIGTYLEYQLRPVLHLQPHMVTLSPQHVEASDGSGANGWIRGGQLVGHQRGALLWAFDGTTYE